MDYVVYHYLLCVHIIVFTIFAEERVLNGEIYDITNSEKDL